MKNMQEAHKCFVYVNLPHHQCRSQGGGHWCMPPPSRRRTGKIFKSSRFGSVTTGYDTLLNSGLPITH